MNGSIFFNRLSEEKQELVFPALAYAERDDIRRLASYPEGTAGSVMTSGNNRLFSMKNKINLSPFSFPIIFFGMAIFIGTVLLHSSVSIASGPISWIDALFTATSATCVTGLTVVDTGTFFTRFGQAVIISLIQLGGLGIMTFTSLIFYLWRQRISLTDRIAVGQSLLHDPTFHLGKFLIRIVFCTFFIEAIGAVLIYIQAPIGFSLYSAVFHAISAFCNAGFSLNSDNLMVWRGNWGINAVFMALILLGGIGFSVLMELNSYIFKKLPFLNKNNQTHRLSWYAWVVIKTSFFLVVIGWVGICFAETIGYHRNLSTGDAILSTLFQSVTCRTAGFNTLDITQMTNVSLLIMIVLMFIGGAPGSCAGGVKITTFRALVALVAAQMKGRRQAVVGKFGIDNATLNKSLILIVFAVAIIFAAMLALNITEGGDVPHPETRGLYLEILFETVSAFGTVGLSTGLTAKLTFAGKCIISMLMFIGRLGPILFLSAIQGFQEEPLYTWPEESMLIG